MLIFNNSKSSHKRNRTFKKFPRRKIKDNKSLKELGYCKNNWIDDDYTFTKGDIKKFLMSNLGKPVDLVYSKFLKRWKSFENPKTEFYSWIKDNIVDRLGGFYTTNGILNYKKPVKKQKPVSKAAANKERFDKLDMLSLLNTLYNIRVPQCIGRFWVGDIERTVYMDNYPPFTDAYNLNPSGRHPCTIEGIGSGINISTQYTSTGKLFYTYSINNDISTIYFYYRA